LYRTCADTRTYPRGFAVFRIRPRAFSITCDTGGRFLHGRTAFLSARELVGGSLLSGERLAEPAYLAARRSALTRSPAAFDCRLHLVRHEARHSPVGTTPRHAIRTRLAARSQQNCSCPPPKRSRLYGEDRHRRWVLSCLGSNR
jgi:hypothetical protein